MKSVKITAITNEYSQDFEQVLKYLSRKELEYVELASMWGKDVINLNNSELDKVEKFNWSYLSRLLSESFQSTIDNK